jgi:hypothetical protein
LILRARSATQCTARAASSLRTYSACSATIPVLRLQPL